MKWIKYKYICGTNLDGTEVFANKKIGYNEANLIIAEAEAYDDYTIEEDEETFPTTTEIPNDVDMTGHNIKNVGEAVEDTDAVSLGEVKGLIQEVANKSVSIIYVSGDKDFNTDFQTSATESAKVIFVNRQKSTSTNASFPLSELRSYAVAVERLFGNGDLEYVLKQTCVSVQFPGTEYAKVYEHQRFYIKSSSSTYWTDWEECGKTADDTILDKITGVKNDIVINKTTLGYQKKNLFKVTISTQTRNGITFTVNNDKSITASGTQSLISNTSYLTIGSFTAPFDGEYILTGYPEGDTSVNTNLGYLQYGGTVIRNSEHKLTMSKGETISLMLCVKAGSVLENRIFKPMIRSADITDDTYEPYADDVDTRIINNKNDIIINQTTLGYRIKNLFDVFSVNWYQPSKTTVAEDGTVTTTVTSDPREFIYSNSDAFVTLGAGTYKIIVNTTDFVSGTYAQINGCDSDNNSVFSLPISSAGIHKTTFTLTERTTVGMVIKPYSQTFTLMICDADFEDESYVPYTNVSVDERLNKKLDILSKEYIPIRYMSGDKDFNVDFQISAEEPAKVTFVNLLKSTSKNAPFPLSELRSYILSVERLYSSGDLEYMLKQTCISVQFAGTEYAKTCEHQRFYIKSSSLTYWTDWEECGTTDVKTRFEKFEQQPLLYSSTSTEESPLTINIPDLFKNYSAVICQMYTSQYTTMFNLTLPLKYIKSLGTGSYYSAESQLLFEYVDDDNLCIRTGMGQSNPTISGVKIIALY